MTRHNIVELLRSSGYYTTDGHYRLVSGKHSDAYIQARISLMDPEICEPFVGIASELLRDVKPTVIAGFTIGGLLLADALAKSLHLSLLRGRKRGDAVEWIDAKILTQGSRVALIDDVLTTSSQVNLAINALELKENSDLVAVLIAVDRSAQTPQLFFRGTEIPVYSCVRIPLTVYDPSACPLCRIGIPPTDLSNPERNFISVLLSQPPQKAEFILKGYEKVYKMQQEEQLLKEMEAWRPWLPVLVAGLPMPRMQEDSRVIRFVSHLTLVGETCGIKPRVLSELVGQLVSLSSIRVESRSIGCSLIVGDPDAVHRTMELKARVRLPIGVSCESLTNLVPYFDAFLETNYVFVLDREGNIVDLRELVYKRRNIHTEGIEALRFVTAAVNSLGFVLRRGRSCISVYGNGRLEAVGELSQRTGLWEFSRPMERVDEISRIVPRLGDSILTVIEASRELVAKGYGGLFVLGNTKGLNYTEPKISLETQHLQEMSIEDIVELAKLDGAVIINELGQVTAATVIIQNREEASLRYATGAGNLHGGSRKETAQRTSLECPKCVTIYVSQNGAIEVYVGGNSWPIAETITGLARG